MKVLRILEITLILALIAGASQAQTTRDDSQRKDRDTDLLNSVSLLSNPIRVSWRYLSEAAMPLQATLQDDRVFVPLAGGIVACLRRSDGELVWIGEIGGRLSQPLAVDEVAVYAATVYRTADGTEGPAAIRALDRSTGLTLWHRDFERPFTSRLKPANGVILVGSADASLHALDRATGDTAWTVSTGDAVRGEPLVSDGRVFFGSDDGALREVSVASGETGWKFQTTGRIVARPLIHEGTLYFATDEGYVYAVSRADSRLKWRARTGAAIEAAPILVGDRLIVVSFDNFVYALSPDSGNTIWKRRLENRITSEPIIDRGVVLISPLRSDHVVAFSTDDGKRVNLFQLERGFEMVASPVYSDGILILPTDQGLVTVTARTEDNKGESAESPGVRRAKRK